MLDRISRGAAIGLIAACCVGTAALAADTQSTRLQAKQLRLTDDATHRYGEPEIAVNPLNPKNIVYYVMSNMLTYKCEAAKDPNCADDPVSRAPVGEFTVPGWISTHLYVTFDGGHSWRDVTDNLDKNSIAAPTSVTDSSGTHLVTHSDLTSRGDPMVTVTANGTFYIGWDTMNLGTLFLPPGYKFRGNVVCPDSTALPGCPTHGLLNGGIAVSKSSDGGLTWSTPQLTGTGVDRPWMTTDLSNGTVYEASSGNINSSMSTGDRLLPAAAPGTPPDRYVVSSADGVSWTQPQGLGGGGFSGGGGSTISAARGHLAAGLHVAAGNDAACQYFLSNPTATSPCTVFETSTDSGAHWSRYSVPGLANASGSILVAADPTRSGTYTVASTDPTTTELQVYVTHDSGMNWSGPAILNDGSSACPPVSDSPCKFKPWINYSPKGVLGLAWRSANVSASSAGAASSSSAPKSKSKSASSAAKAPKHGNSVALMANNTVGPVSHAADATNEPPPCDFLGCGVSPPDDENTVDPAPVPYTIWAAISNDAGATFSKPLQISQVPSAPADPNMLTGTDDTSVIALSDEEVLVGWGQWPASQHGDPPVNLAAYVAEVKLAAFNRRGGHADDNKK